MLPWIIAAALLLAAGLAYLGLRRLLPVFVLPAPTGPHPVGTLAYEWVQPNDRAITVQIWYPAAPRGDEPRARYATRATARGMGSRLKLPGFLFAHLARVTTHALVAPPPAGARAQYPVILFSHGWGGLKQQNSFQTEELASHGYIVAAINHTGDAAYAEFQSRPGVPFEHPTEDLYRDERPMAKRLETWIADAAFVLDQLAHLNRTDERLAGRLDLERIGYLGHSFGGCTAYTMLARDSRVRAAINMDGGHFGEAASARSDKPFLLMRGDLPPITDAQLKKAKLTRAEYDAYIRQIDQRWLDSSPTELLRLHGAQHMSFTDLPLMVPIMFRRLRPIHREVNEAALAFFQAHLH